jgi:hypothetical protein
MGHVVTGLSAGMIVWAALQLLSVLGVWNYWWHLPVDRQIEAPGDVVVILSVRDDWDGGAALIAALKQQAITGFRLIIATSGNCVKAQGLAAGQPNWIEVISAGLASDEGQKIHKLRAAVTSLRPADRYLVFIDADILPPQRFIGRLLFPLVRGKVELATGYRMLLPASALLGWIGAAEMQVATMPRLASGTMPWGGAMAITRRAADQIGLADALAGRLLDDVSIGLLAHRAGLRLRAVRDLLVATPLDGGIGSALEFLVRQYRHVLTNSRAMWGKAFAIVALQSAGWGFAMTLGGRRAIAIGYFAAWARVALRHQILSSVLEPEQLPAARRSLLWDAVLPFAVVWLHLGVQIAAACSRRIRWGGYDYWVKDGRVIRMARV